MLLDVQHQLEVLMTRPEKTETVKQAQRIADALEEHRDGLEEIAATDTPFAPRAQAAQNWIEEHHQERADD